MPHTPPRFSEPSFRRYELIIAQVVQTFPAPVRVETGLLNLSPETVSARLRDAATGYRNFSYYSAHFTVEEFLAVWPQIEVSNQGDHVLIYRRGDRPGKGQPVPPTSQEVEVEESQKWSRSEVIALAQLLSSRKIVSRVNVSGWTATALQEVIDTGEFDCAVVEEDGRTYLL